MSARNYDVLAGPGQAVVKHWTRGVPFEDGAREQVLNVARMPFVRGVAVMPDVHKGFGATVGSVIATRKAIIPAAVGVDIGCGMMAVQTSLTASQLPDSLYLTRTLLEEYIPHGRTDNGGRNDRGAWGDPPDEVLTRWARLGDRFAELVAKHPKLDHPGRVSQLGTLGTGNHFVEICIDEAQAVWVMLHSGSRGVGNRIGSYFIERAKREMERWHVSLPDMDLAYLPEGSELYEDYCDAVEWAQLYASSNRFVMMGAALAALADGTGLSFAADSVAINCHHNYVSHENHGGENVLVTRKGAVRARLGDLGIIPGSMGARSYIVRGLGNADSFHSCSHGAGRVMSRTEAKRSITLEQHVAATAGIECRKDADVIDESPAAYKDIDAVMAAQRDLVEIVHTLRQVVCVKG